VFHFLVETKTIVAPR